MLFYPAWNPGNLDDLCVRRGKTSVKALYSHIKDGDWFCPIPCQTGNARFLLFN